MFGKTFMPSNVPVILEHRLETTAHLSIWHFLPQKCMNWWILFRSILWMSFAFVMSSPPRNDLWFADMNFLPLVDTIKHTLYIVHSIHIYRARSIKKRKKWTPIGNAITYKWSYWQWKIFYVVLYSIYIEPFQNCI